MAATGAVSSFASPLVTMPYLLDQYQLPQDLMALFILPGFITMRLGDVVGVMHLMALTLIVTQALQRRLTNSLATIGWRRHWHAGVPGFRWARASRWYLASTTLDYDLDKQFSVARDPVGSRRRGRLPICAMTFPSRPPSDGSTLERIKDGKGTAQLAIMRTICPIRSSINSSIWSVWMWN